MPLENTPDGPVGAPATLDAVSPVKQLTFRAALEHLPPYSAGRSARDARKPERRSGPIAALAANEGPYGPFPNAVSAVQLHAATVNRYPESGFTTLREHLSRHLALPLERVAAAAGGVSVIHHLSLALLEPGDEVLQSSPTFHAYALDARKLGARAVSVPVTSDGRYDLAAMHARIGSRTRLIYVCNPNNPTGGIVRRDELLEFVRSVPAHIAILVDEAYFEYVEEPDYPDTIGDPAFHLPNLLTLRTFSKAYGLAGLRVAYAVGAPQIVAALGKLQSNYEVTTLSQVAAIASLENRAELDKRRALNRAGRAALIAGVRALGLEPLPSQANFICVPVGAAKALATALESRGVIVRPLDAMGDPGSIRITVGTEAEIRQALEALAAVCDGCRNG
jgi:histidinol-phosphate aminotransferase